MLKGISAVLSPELLKILAEMGHGDEIVLADAHFPGHTFCEKVLRMDGIQIPDLLDGILPLFELDEYVDSPVFMMQAVPGDELDPEVGKAYRVPIDKHAAGTPDYQLVERFAFYEQAKKAYACVLTGSTMKYGNIILKKGVTPIA
ncbi:MAG: L-fucose mutarotase [Planctomycetes bacterium]|nr:L-fucose mutarotase [Planctomycetota bacterium]